MLDDCKYIVRNCDLNFTTGLNIVNPEVGNFIANFFKEFLNNSDNWRWSKKCGKFVDVKPGPDKDDLGYITIWCNYKEETIKYSSSYADGKLFEETLTLGNKLIGHYNYEDEELDTGILYWNTLGCIYADMDSINVDTKLLCNTYAGYEILNAIRNYRIAGEKEFNKTPCLGDWRLFLGGKDRTPEINKLLPIFGFDLCEINPSDSMVYHKIGNSRVGFTIDAEGSGFNHLIDIIPEVLMCQETGHSLIIPNYSTFLHPLIQKQLKTYLQTSGVNIIATS